MSKCNINCHAIEHGKGGKVIRQWEITPEGRMWPCCNFANGWDSRFSPELLDNPPPTDVSVLLLHDRIIMDVMNNTPEWNDLEHHTLEEIMSHELYQKYIFTEGWNSDNPPPVCVINCGDSDDESIVE